MKYDEIMPSYGIRLKKEQWEECDRYMEKLNLNSKNEFVRQAVEFYLSWLGKRNLDEFLGPAIESVVSGKISESEVRVSRILFKMAVEIGIIAKILSAVWELSEGDLKEFRKEAIRDLKETNGIIKIEEEF